MRVSWMERKTNVWVLENMKPEWTLESRVAQAALKLTFRKYPAIGATHQLSYIPLHHVTI